MLDQERGHHHPHAVMHDAGVPKLAHAGIDDGVTGLTALPGGERLLVVPPRKGVERRLQIARGEIGYVEQQMPAEFAPAELAQEFVGIAGERGTLGGGKMRGMPDLARADLAETQMRREAGGAVAIGPVAIVRCSRQAIAEKILEPLLGGAFARRPGFAQAAGPVRPGRLETQTFDGFAGQTWSRAQMGRGGQGIGRCAHRLHAPPERREYPQAPAFLGPHGLRRGQEIAGKAFAPRYRDHAAPR